MFELLEMCPKLYSRLPDPSLLEEKQSAVFGVIAIFSLQLLLKASILTTDIQQLPSIVRIGMSPTLYH